MSKNLKLAKLWSIACVILSLGGCVWQATNISQRYFAYGTINQVELVRPTQILPPQVITCMATNEFPLIRVGSMYYKPIKEVIKRFPTPNETLSEAMLPIDIFHLKASRCRLARLMKDRKICYSCIPKVSAKREETDIMASSYGIGIIVLSPNETRRVSSLRIFLHPANRNLYGRSFNYVDHELGLVNGKAALLNKRVNSKAALLNKKVLIGYTHYETNLMPWPHKTGCFDYKAANCESRAHCIEMCEQDVETIIGYPPKLGKFLGVAHLGLESTTLTYPYGTHPPNVTKSCQKKYSRPDCHDEEFIPKIVHIEKFLDIWIQLMAPNEPDFISTALPQMNGLDYFVYILSVVSFWLGFCPLTFFRDEKLVKFLFERSPSDGKSSFVRVDSTQLGQSGRVVQGLQRLHRKQQITEDYILHMKTKMDEAVQYNYYVTSALKRSR